VDWGAFAANVSKSDILAFIEEVYAADPTYKTPDRAPHLYPKLQELLDVIHALPDGRTVRLGSRRNLSCFIAPEMAIRVQVR
jgi:hypothetical protein